MSEKFGLIVFKIKMFISSYFPLYVILIILNYKYYSTCDEFISLIKFEEKLISITFGILLLLIVISLVVLKDLRSTVGNDTLDIKKVEKMEEALITYFATYVLPLLADDFFELEQILKNFMLFVLIGFMYIKSNLIYLNPSFLLMGYSIYKVNKNMILITNISFDHLIGIADEVNPTKLNSRVVCGKIYIIQKSDNNI